MRRARVYNKQRLAGYLEELDDGTFRFQYEPEYLADESADPATPVSPTEDRRRRFLRAVA
jgi:HipA-like protein